MILLGFDISSGGVSAALFGPDLKASRVVDKRWSIAIDDSGAATLDLDEVMRAIKDAVSELDPPSSTAAVSIGCMMHSLVLLDDSDHPVTPVFTWLDRRGQPGVAWMRERLGDFFHQRTGCRFHPMFPVFKLAWLRLQGDPGWSSMRRAVSLKAAIIRRLTGTWAEDHGMASASGLYNLADDRWDPEILSLTGLESDRLPAVCGRNQVVGRITASAAKEFRVHPGTPVVNGSGDGLLANVGSGCESPDCIAVTLGTSASARQSLAALVVNESSGTFCYKADKSAYVLGCASNNGGNVLDWGRAVLAGVENESLIDADIPIFIPLLHGERSPEWNPSLTGTWYGLTSRHAGSHLKQSVVEGVVFNLVQYVEILEDTSAAKARQIVLSGNGFLSGMAARVFANLVSARTVFMKDPGLATLRGAAICAIRALGGNAEDAMKKLAGDARVIPRAGHEVLEARFHEYKKLRGLKELHP